jgi:hypothetical protein
VLDPLNPDHGSIRALVHSLEVPGKFHNKSLPDTVTS